MLVETAIKKHPNGYTTASILQSNAGMFKVTVIHRFDSGNFIKEPEFDNLSLVAAKGLLHFYTS